MSWIRFRGSSTPPPPTPPRAPGLVATLLALALAVPAARAERLYVVGELAGGLRAGLTGLAVLTPFADADLAPADVRDAAPVVMSGATAARLPAETAERLAVAFRSGWPLAVLAADVAEINALHQAARTGQVFKVAPGGRPPEAFAFVRRADTGYSQMRITAGGAAVEDAGHRAQRAAGLLSWLGEARRRNLQATIEPAATSAADDSSAPDDLTQIVSAWTDSPYFYLSDGTTGGQSLFQCNAEVWQAYQVATATDFYYLEQNCNFSPQNTYAIRGKELDVGLPLSIVGADADWNQVAWSSTTNGSKYCPDDGDGTVYTACDYYNYALGYTVNLQPNTPSGTPLTDVEVVVLQQENPPTTTSSATVTEGMSYSISGQVVAGSAGASVSATAGVDISTSTTTTIPDVTITNESATSSTNAAWSYTMNKVKDIDDSCSNSMSAPASVQTSTFNPRQDMIWSAASSYRTMSGFDGTFDVALTFAFEGFESTMYVDEEGTRHVSDLSGCNIFACSCAVVTNGPWTHGSGVQILSIPVPSTDYSG